MKKHRWAMIALAGVVLLMSCAPESTQPDEPVPETAVPDEIVIEHHNLFPEGLEYDEGGERFLLGSMTEGTIYKVADDGTLEPFIEDDELQMSIGIEIDHINNRLLVANTGHSEEQGMLGAYDLETGQRIFMANLSDFIPVADTWPMTWQWIPMASPM